MKTKLKLQDIFNPKILNPFIFFKDNINWFKISFFIFLLSFFGGAITYFYPELNIFYPLIKAAFSDLSKVAEGMKDVSNLDKIVIILINNLTVAGLLMISGIFLGIIPLFILTLNGLVLGFFVSMIIFSEITLYVKILMILSLLPHALIEIYSIFTASSYSFKLGIAYLLPNAKGSRIKTFIVNLKESFSIIIFVFFGLALASIVEVLDMIILKALVE